MISAPDLAERVERARQAMDREGIDVMLLSAGRDLPYLTGYEATPLERLTMAVVHGSGDLTLVVPELEAPRVVEHPGVFEVVSWSETEDPIEIVAAKAGRPGCVAIGDETWSTFLLSLQERLPDASFVRAGPIVSSLRIHKSPAEVGLLRAAAEAADRVMVRLAGMELSGHTEGALAALVSEMLVEEGHDAAAFAIVAAGKHSASPHHEPGGAVIVPGDVVVLDFGGRMGGYHSDTTRTFYVGEVSAEAAAVHEVVREAQEAALEAAVAGASGAQVDEAARSVISDAGYGDHFIHRTGHGIGLDVHEQPYLVAGSGSPLGPGMAFSIEPGVYLPDDFGVRIEDIVVLGEDGPERLNRSPRDPVVVG